MKKATLLTKAELKNVKGGQLPAPGEPCTVDCSGQILTTECFGICVPDYGCLSDLTHSPNDYYCQGVIPPDGGPQFFPPLW